MRKFDTETYRVLSVCEENWKYYIQSKRALAEICSLNESDLYGSHPLSLMLMADLAKTMEFYLPRLQKLVSSFNQKDRSHEYNRIYLESFFMGHLIDELKGVNINLGKRVTSVLWDNYPSIDVYDVGGGLCYWSDLLTKQEPNMLYTKHVVEKQTMIDLMSTSHMLTKYPHMKEYVTHGEHWLDPDSMVLGNNSVVIVAQFLHLFSTDEAMNIVTNMLRVAIDKTAETGKVLFLFIEPMDTQSHIPMFSFNMKEQMQIMKGIDSCAFSIMNMIDSLTKDISYTDSLIMQLQRRVTDLESAEYAVLPVLIDKDFEPGDRLKSQLERRLQ